MIASLSSSMLSVISRVSADGSSEDSASAAVTSAGRSSARELLRGDVHADAEGRIAQAPPAPGLLARLEQDHAAQRQDHSGLLGEWDELVGEHEAAFRMPPAKQCLDPGDLTRLERDDRLVVELELLSGVRTLQVGLECKPLEHALVHGGLVDRVPRLPLVLRAVHGEIGAAQDLARRLTSRAERDADARLNHHLRAEHRNRLGHRGQHAARDGHCIVRPGQVLDHDGELVPAEPRTRVLGAKAALEPARHHRQKLVAGRMAEAVVHRLEVVEVEEEHGEKVLPTSSSAEGMGHTVTEESSVREPGKGVVECLVRELLLERTPLGHVSGRDDDAVHRGEAEEVVEDALELADRAVLSSQRQVSRHRQRRRVTDVCEESAYPLGVVRLHELGQSGADELVLAVAEHAFDRGRVVSDREVGREQRDDIARVLDE